jgi:hypothetical protein
VVSSKSIQLAYAKLGSFEDPVSTVLGMGADWINTRPIRSINDERSSDSIRKLTQSADSTDTLQKQLRKNIGLSEDTSLYEDKAMNPGGEFALPALGLAVRPGVHASPAVMAHELGHIADYKSGVANKIRLLMPELLSKGGLSLIALAPKLTEDDSTANKVMRGLGYAGTVIGDPLATYYGEHKAWDHARVALDKLKKSGIGYTEKDRQAAEDVRTSALNTYRIYGALEALKNLTMAGGIDFLGRRQLVSDDRLATVGKALGGYALGQAAVGAVLGSIPKHQDSGFEPVRKLFAANFNPLRYNDMRRVKD